MKKETDVPKGSNVINISATGHTFVRLLDAKGEEVFRSASSAERVTAIVQPGAYTIDTDGKLGKVELSSLESLDPAFRRRPAVDATKPPMPKG
jgi:hypothetical protein